jgi:nucleoid DNA-binding protein
LHPRKAKDLIPQVAKETNLSEETINNIMGFYWREVRKNLSSLKHSRVHITNLGDFVTKHWKIDDKIEMLEKFEENNRQKGLQQMTARFKTAETLFDLKALKAIMTEEKQRADFIKMHKSHESKRKHNKNLED